MNNAPFQECLRRWAVSCADQEMPDPNLWAAPPAIRAGKAQLKRPITLRRRPDPVPLDQSDWQRFPARQPRWAYRFARPLSVLCLVRQFDAPPSSPPDPVQNGLQRAPRNPQRSPDTFINPKCLTITPMNASF